MNNAEPTLPSNRAFVVQFRTTAAPAPEGYSGRVEHVVSGQAARFDSPEELLAFFAAMLLEVNTQAGSKSHRGGT